MKKQIFAAGLSTLLALFAGAAGAATTYIYNTPGNGTWVSPVTGNVQVECWGGGGGAGGAGAHYASTGGGAGGSYVIVTSVAVSAGTTYQLTVGAGGTAGAGGAAGTGATGGTGGSSYFGNTTAGNSAGASVLAVGGAGSVGNNAAGTGASARTQTGGATASNSGNIPSSGTAGTTGATGSTTANNSGAGGAGAGPSGSSGGGAGGAALTGAGNGNAGSAPGGGGGGADQSSSSSNGTGGAGGAGQVVITVSTPVPFTPGNLAVLVPGNASTNNTTITILELMTNSSGQLGGYTVGIDGTDANGLRMSGSAGTSGYLADSADGTLLAFSGANSAISGSGVNTITNRGVGTLNAAANYVLQTTYTNPAAATTPSQPRCASTSDNVHWGISDQSGMYTNYSAGPQPVGSFLAVKNFGGTYYTMVASATVPAVMTFSGTATNYLTGIPVDASATDFYLISSGQHGATFDVLYYIDNTGTTAGNIYKYYSATGTAGSWTSAGSAYNTGVGGWGLCAATNSSGGVNLYYTTGSATTGNSVYQLTDTAAWNAGITASGIPLTLYTAPVSNLLKGIAFVPAAAAPTVASSAATPVGTTSATLNGSVTYDGGTNLTSYGFYWGTGSPITTASNLVTVGTSDYSGSFNQSLTGLSVNSNYFYRAYADNAAGNTLGGLDVSFWTLANTPAAPTVGSPTASSLNVTIGAGDGNPGGTMYAIKETTSGQFIQSGGTLGGSAVFQTGSTWSTKTVTGLIPATTYGFAVEATNGAGVSTVFGTTNTATTSTPPTPTISVTPNILSFPPTAVNGTSANLTYSILGDNLTGNITNAAPANFQISTNSGSGFGSSVTLTPSGGQVASKTIYVRFQPTSQTGYSENITNTSGGANNPMVAVSGIGALAPSVTTQAANPTNVSSATLNGTATATNGALILDRGFYWSASAGITTSSTKLSEGGTTLGAFSKTVTGLNTNAAYYYRAYASNSIGLTLGSADQIFYSLAATPTAPTVGSPTVSTLNVAIGAGDGNPATTAYAIQETNSGKYVQLDGSLAASPEVFKTASLWGTTTVNGLNYGTEYAFAVTATNAVGIPTAFGPATIAYTANVPFTQGNLAVLSANDASANNTAFVILEVTPGGNLVQTVPINATSGTNALRASGSASSAPKLADTSDGTLLVLAGFNSTNGPPTSANAITNREVATLDMAARFTVRTKYVGISGNQVRSATTVDNKTWFVGDAGGIYTNGTIAPLNTNNIACLKSYGGVVYALQNSKKTVPLSTVSADGETLTPIPSTDTTLTSRDSSVADFCMLASGQNGSTNDLLYTLDETATNAGTINKYYLDVGNTGKWILAGSYDDSVVDTGMGYYGLGGFGLVAATNSSGSGDVDLYLTTGDGTVANNSLWHLVEAGGASAGGWQSGPNITSTFALRYVVGGGTLKGVAFVPNQFIITSGSLQITGSGASASSSFSFIYTSGKTINVLGTNNLAASSATWPVLGTATESPSGTGHYQFTDPNPATNGQTFYRLQIP